MNADKTAVHDFWDAASCGEDLYLTGQTAREAFENQARVRYELEPYITDFAGFSQTNGQKVLEIGVGLGADHQQFAENGAILSGCDLTNRAIEHTRNRLAFFNLKSDLRQADAENLPFADGQFDLVYSWGVIHHSPETAKAAREIHRVLRPGGEARVMIYHKKSFVGYMLWLRYGLFKGRPGMSLKTVYSSFLESPGTKAYTLDEARKLFADFSKTEVSTVLTHGDLLTSQAGQRHKGALLDLARLVWPRWIIRRFFPSHGLFLLVKAVK